jgi:adenylate kinase family enzyme
MAMRVVIMGNAGSGKSTLASRLARESSLVHLDLDTLAWEREAVRRPLADSLALLEGFLARNDAWVVEGCYADLLARAVSACSRLIFLNPGVEVCVANCRARPWEPHKYPSPEAQDKNLALLIDWVRQYETREDEYSLRRHREIFDSHAGDKVEVRTLS